jgi:hypothetical protein
MTQRTATWPESEPLHCISTPLSLLNTTRQCDAQIEADVAATTVEFTSTAEIKATTHQQFQEYSTMFYLRIQANHFMVVLEVA